MDKVYDEHGNYLPFIVRVQAVYRGLLKLEGKYGIEALKGAWVLHMSHVKEGESDGG